ncbi:DUF2953 domain-containing protein [Halonatronum saccharophilum]|uniref:DUF2953 domain-containing protein n=1 Tax=Halonatronum saccharophilum TaxID=150060 RepID=UPI0004856E4C|nr:DUF2953 domain-containing protein [Halonatronum saccharophilum]
MILILIILALIILYFIPVKLRMDLICKQKNKSLHIKVSGMLMIINDRVKIPYLNIEECFSLSNLEFKGEFESIFEEGISAEESLGEKESLEDIKIFFNRLDIDPNLIRFFFEKVNNCDYFLWRSSFGFSNPAYTGIITGLLWGLKGSVVGLMSNNLKLEKDPVFEICPDFDGSSPLKFEIKGIFKLNLGKIIRIGFTIVSSKIKKRRRKYEQRTSH